MTKPKKTKLEMTELALLREFYRKSTELQRLNESNELLRKEALFREHGVIIELAIMQNSTIH